MMQEVKLNRTDKRPMAFFGEEIYDGTTKVHDSTRWDVLRVFEVERGYIIGWARLTCWEGERDSYDAIKADSDREVVSFVEQWVPSLKEPVLIALRRNNRKGKNGKENNSGSENIQGIPGKEDVPDLQDK